MKSYILQKKGRIYKVGEKLREFPPPAINKFLEWSESPFKEQAEFDHRFVYALLLLCVDKEDINSNINDDAMEFIRGITSNQFIY